MLDGTYTKTQTHLTVCTERRVFGICAEQETNRRVQESHGSETELETEKWYNSQERFAASFPHLHSHS